MIFFSQVSTSGLGIQSSFSRQTRTFSPVSPSKLTYSVLFLPPNQNIQFCFSRKTRTFSPVSPIKLEQEAHIESVSNPGPKLCRTLADECQIGDLSSTSLPCCCSCCCLSSGVLVASLTPPLPGPKEILLVSKTLCHFLSLPRVRVQHLQKCQIPFAEKKELSDDWGRSEQVFANG